MLESDPEVESVPLQMASDPLLNSEPGAESVSLEDAPEPLLKFESESDEDVVPLKLLHVA